VEDAIARAQAMIARLRELAAPVRGTAHRRQRRTPAARGSSASGSTRWRESSGQGRLSECVRTLERMERFPPVLEGVPIPTDYAMPDDRRRSARPRATRKSTKGIPLRSTGKAPRCGRGRKTPEGGSRRRRQSMATRCSGASRGPLPRKAFPAGPVTVVRRAAKRPSRSWPAIHPVLEFAARSGRPGSILRSASARGGWPSAKRSRL
jgi:hypothetical protein